MRVLIRPGWSEDLMMKRICRTAEQIIGKLKAAAQLIAEGKPLPLCAAPLRPLGRRITDWTQWKVGMQAETAKGFTQLGSEMLASRSFWQRLS